MTEVLKVNSTLERYICGTTPKNQSKIKMMLKNAPRRRPQHQTLHEKPIHIDLIILAAEIVKYFLLRECSSDSLFRNPILLKFTQYPQR